MIITNNLNTYKIQNRKSNFKKLNYSNYLSCQNTINLNNSPNAIYNTSFTGLKLNLKHDLAHYEGCILGGAIGDALGAPVEFMKLSEIYKKFGSKGITLKSFLESKTPLEFSDDTQMTFFTADGMLKSSIKNHSKYKIDFMDVYESYRDWLNTQIGGQIDKGWISRIKELYQVKAPGNTCIASIMDNIPGTITNKINNSKGNGGVMRVAPIGLLYYRNPNMAFKVAEACTALTHSNPDAYLSAGMFASIISHIIQGKTLDEAVNKSIVILKRQENSENIINKIKQAIDLAKDNINSQDAIKSIGEGNIGSEALSLAIYSALKNKMNFSKSIETAANINGDSDTVAAITGNIVGAFQGINGLPKKVLSILTNFRELKILSRDLFVKPNNIHNKTERYPIYKNYSKSYTLDDILAYSKDKTLAKQKYKKFLDEIYKKVGNIKIENYREFLLSKDIPQNVIDKIIIPTELISNELKNKNNFHRLLHILSTNYDNLVKKENARGCFSDERFSVEDILWTLYEKVLNNGNIDELCKKISYMINTNEYNIKAIVASIN